MSAPEKNKKKGFRLEHWHFISLALALFDAVAVNAAHYAALWLRYDCRFFDIPYFYIDILTFMAPLYALVCLVVFSCCKMYKTIWRFAGMHELYLSILATLVTLIVQIGGSIAVSWDGGALCGAGRYSRPRPAPSCAGPGAASGRPDPPG